MKTDNSGSPDRYSSLRPVYSLNILGYNHFTEDEDALRVFTLYDEQRKKAFGKNLIKVGYFELNKPNIETDNQRYWRDYFLTGTAPDGAPDYIKKASKILQYVNLGEEEREVFDIIEKAHATWEGELFTAYHDGREEGEASGWQKGREEGEASGWQKGRAEGEASGWQKGRAEGEASGWQKGRAEGEASGWQKGVYETARNALAAGASVAFITKITGLDEKVVRDLAETLK
jgi:hypothetical protein